MIGYDPIVETMIIIDGQDFSHFFGVDPADPFPAGTALTLKMYDRQGDQLGAWPAATVQPGGGLVQISAEDLINIPDSAQFRVYVEYPDTQQMCWYRGRVWRRA